MQGKDHVRSVAVEGQGGSLARRLGQGSETERCHVFMDVSACPIFGVASSGLAASGDEPRSVPASPEREEVVGR